MISPKHTEYQNTKENEAISIVGKKKCILNINACSVGYKKPGPNKMTMDNGASIIKMMTRPTAYGTWINQLCVGHANHSTWPLPKSHETQKTLEYFCGPCLFSMIFSGKISNRFMFDSCCFRKKNPNPISWDPIATQHVCLSQTRLEKHKKTPCFRKAAKWQRLCSESLWYLRNPATFWDMTSVI